MTTVSERPAAQKRASRTAGRLPMLPPNPAWERRADGSVLLWQDYPVLPHPPTVAHLFVDRARSFPDRTLIAERERGADGAPGPWRGLTYGETLQRALAVASGLRQRGFTSEDRILALCDASLDHAVLMFGAMLAGVPMAVTSTAYSLSGDFERLQSVAEVFRPTLIYADDARRFGRALSLFAQAGVKLLTSTPCEAAPALELAELASTPALPAETFLAEITPDTIHKVIFTSGSTGRPKAAIHTHRMGVASVAFEATYLATHLRPSADDSQAASKVEWLPWSHAGGSSWSVHLILTEGGTYYIDAGRPAPGKFEETILNLQEHPPTYLGSAPLMMTLVCEAMETRPAFRDRLFSRLEYVKYGGGMIPTAIVERFQAQARAQTGHTIPFTSSYATTETLGVTVLNWESDTPNLIGLPKPGVLVKLAPIQPDRFEIRVKSDAVTPGYLNDPMATAAAFDEEGFFRTGDVAALADREDPGEGLIFVGRLGDNFKLASGTWVASAHVHDALTMHLPRWVKDSLIVGEGQAYLAALAWLDPAAPDPQQARAELQAALREHNSRAGGSSRRVERLLVSETPIEPTHFERTEKGSLNRNLIVENRPDEMAALFADMPGPQVICA